VTFVEVSSISIFFYRLLNNGLVLSSLLFFQWGSRRLQEQEEDSGDQAEKSQENP
jgi:hypothetical protein